MLNLGSGQPDGISHILPGDTCRQKRAFPVILLPTVFFELEGTGEIEGLCSFTGEEHPFLEVRAFHMCLSFHHGLHVWISSHFPDIIKNIDFLRLIGYDNAAL